MKCGTTVKFRERRLGIAATRGVDDVFERRLGGVADNGLDVVMADRPLPLGIERELDDLGARQGLVGAESRHQIVARLFVDAETSSGEFGVDQL